MIGLSASIDTSVIERWISEIVAFGKRTMVEQCVTRAAIICINAQADTAAVLVGTIESDLEVEVSPAVLKSGRLSKNKRRQREVVGVQKGARVPMAVLIVMARTNPNSKYSRLTGNRWPLQAGMFPSGPGSKEARQAQIAVWVSRMAKARFSSTHLLQHGWTAAIRLLLGDPNFVGWASKNQNGADRSVLRLKLNPLNRLGPEALGDATVNLLGDSVTVFADNAIGQAGNEVLDAKHRLALIEQGTGPLQAAIDRESAVMQGKVGDYFDQGLKQRWQNIL